MSSDLTSIYSQRRFSASNSSKETAYEFEGFRLETAGRMLYKDDQPIHLAPKVVETLLALVRCGGEIVSKEKLMSEVWEGSFVDESNLTQNIYLLRKTLGRGADGRELIETYRRRGYLFTGEITKISAAADSPKNLAQTNDGRHETADLSNGADFDTQTNKFAEKTAASNYKNAKRFLAAALAAVVLISAFYFIAPPLFDSRNQNGQPHAAAASNLKNTRLTPDINIVSAAFTPDGKYLVYTVREKGKNSVWLKDLATAGAAQIQPEITENYYSATVSRDNFLYYVTARDNSPNGTLVRVSLAGGSEQIIARDLTSPFALSPDQKQVAFIDGKWKLMIANTDAAEVAPRFLAARDRETKWFEAWSSRLSWSPDGASIVVCGGRKIENGTVLRELVEISTADGSEKIIPTPADWYGLDDAVWLADKSALIVTVRETAAAPFQIWRVAYPDGRTQRITNDSNDYTDLNVSADANRIVAVKNFGNLNLWLAPFKDFSKVRQITYGSAAQDGFWGVSFTPDGKIIYTSPRDGNFDLWQLNANGEQKQLTKNSGDWNTKPQITADSRYIIFASSRSGTRQIWRMDADGGNPKQLTEEVFADEPSLSPDGQNIYFTIKADEKSYISKVSIDGGKSVRISRPPQDFYLPVVSPNGKYIFCRFHESSSNSPWKSGVIDSATGEIVRIFDYVFGATQWTPDSKALLYSLGAENLWQISIEANSKPQRLAAFESGGIRNFAISNDSKQIVFARGNSTNEAVLLENF